MQLNLNKKKFLSEENVAQIVKIGINFAERLNSIESETIADYDNTKTYLKGESCYHNNYIYRCKATATGDWDFSRWELIGDEITELTKDDIKDMLGLSDEELETLSNIILDSEVRLDKTYSSSKIYTDIQNAIQTSKDYTLTELGKMNGASYKVVTDVNEMTDEKVIYLLQNGSTYDMYIVDSETPTRIGDVSIDLSDYYTKTEIDNDFLKKSDATSTYVTKTEVNDKVDKTSIKTAISTTPSNDNVLSEKYIDENIVKKSDISTTIDDTSTDSQVPSAKVVYDGLEAINDFSVQVVTEKLDLNDIIETGIYYFSQTYAPVNIPTGVNGWLVVMKGNSSNVVKQVWYRQGTANANSYNTFERYKGGDTWSEWTKFLTEKEYYSALNSGNTAIPENSDLNDYITAGVYTCAGSAVAKTLANCPHIDSNFKLIVNKNTGNDTVFFGYQMIVGTMGGNPVKDICIYYRGVTTDSGTYVFSKWKKMSGSTIADVPKKRMTFSNETYCKPLNNEEGVVYEVKNGICFVYVKITNTLTSTDLQYKTFCTGLPKPSINIGLSANDRDFKGSGVSFALTLNGELQIICTDTTNVGKYYTTFSYPVAES